MRERLLRLGLVGVLLLGATAGVACDKEDKKDIEEVGDDINKGVDDLDSDGKDD